MGHTHECENRIRVAIVDDHHLVREGLRSFLQLAPDLLLVGEGVNGLDAIAIVKAESVDVMLMDLVMPELDGVQAIQEIAKIRPDVRIVALTSFQDTDRILAALHAGAVGYLEKNVDPDDLLVSIRQVYAGRTVLDPLAFNALRHSPEQAHNSGGQGVLLMTGASNELVEPLTGREQEVLALLSRGFSNKEIGGDLGISEKTVKVHVGHVLAKLGVYDRTQAAMKAVKLGLVTLD